MMMLTLLAAAAATPPASYRALGTEPFWNIAIDGSQLRVSEPGKPDVLLLARSPSPIPNGWRWHSRAITVEAVRAPCSDGMSDRSYPDRVTVTYRGRMLKGCGGAAEGAGALADTAWRVTAIDGRAQRLPRPATMRFTANRIEGNGGCNRFGGSYALERDRLSAGPLMSTRMACAGPGMRVEQRLLEILGAPVRVERRGDRVMILSNAKGSVTLRRE